MAFENFPYTNFHEINLDWIVARVKEAYSASNPPDYPVKSVNGMTGDVIIAIPANLVQSVNGETGEVILYRNPLVQFPTTGESRWNLFRICDGDERGIEFDEDGAHRIEGTRRILIYDEENQPDFPVTSVNGQTGDVRITAGVNSVNGKTGNVVTPFINPNTDILKLDSNSNTVLWGISRDVAGGNVALYISRGTGTPQAFIRYTPNQGEAVNLPLLSSADIPESAGVVSINGQTGSVTLYGTDINIDESNIMTVSQKLTNTANLATAISDTTLENSADVVWTVGGISPASGGTNSMSTVLRTGFLPDNIVLIAQKNAELLFRLYAYENNTFVGVYHPDTNTFSPESSGISRFNMPVFINLKEIKKTYPAYRYRITANLYTGGEMAVEYGAEIGVYYPGEGDISQIQTEIAALQAADSTHDQQISALQAKDATHDQQISALQTSDTTQNSQISALQTSDTAQNQQIASLQSADSTHDQQIAALQAKDNTQDQQIAELYTRTGVYVISIPNANTLPLRYPATGTDEKIKDTNKVVSMDLSIPGAQVSNWTITTYNGYLEISGIINGSTNITLYLA